MLGWKFYKLHFLEETIANLNILVNALVFNKIRKLFTNFEKFNAHKNDKTTIL